ncbi:AAA family ATPase [Pseudahrensia aquimaris]|uniref:AAA family ATPase n=1 Tax=Pseudahrensia aquimaris TaxID=744461 RepID=A0ABW3FAC9_9HYPH
MRKRSRPHKVHNLAKRAARSHKRRSAKMNYRLRSTKGRKLTKTNARGDHLLATASVQPLVQLIDKPELLELAPLLDELLTKQTDCVDMRDDVVDEPDFIIQPSKMDGQNNLLSAQLLYLLLAGVPIARRRLISQLPMIALRTTIPNSTWLYFKVVNEGCEDSAVELYTLLNRAALLENSKVIADIADAVLYNFAVDRDCDALFPLLVRRFSNARPTGITITNSVMHTVVRCAEARLTLMQLQKGAAVADMGDHVFPGGLGEDFDLSIELSKIIVNAEATPFQCIRLWLDAQMDVVRARAPDLVERWEGGADEEDTDIKIGSLSMRSMKRKAHSPDSLIAILRDVKRLHSYWIDGTEVAHGGQDLPSSSIKPSSKTSSNKADSKDLFDDFDLVRPARSKERNRPNQTSGAESTYTPEQPSLVVLPSLPKRNGDTHHDPLKVFREELVGKELPLLPTPDLSDARAQLIKMLPHLASVTDRILSAMVPHASIKLPPVLLVGQPGCGKTTLLEELVKAVDVPSITIDAAGTADAHMFGTDNRWGNSSAGVHLNVIMEHQIANPVIILDELEKLGGSLKNGDPRTKLLGFLEPRRASSLFDSFLAAPLNVSALSWVFTANRLRDVPTPLQNRLEIIRCPSPKPEHLEALAPQLLLAAYAERGLSADWCEPLTANELATLKRHWRGGSIRNLRRLIRVVVDSRDKFMTAV